MRRGRTPLPRLKIFSTSCSFSENLAISYVGAPPPPRPHPERLAPPPTGNPGSAPVNVPGDWSSKFDDLQWSLDKWDAHYSYCALETPERTPLRKTRSRLVFHVTPCGESNDVNFTIIFYIRKSRTKLEIFQYT